MQEGDENIKLSEETQDNSILRIRCKAFNLQVVPVIDTASQLSIIPDHIFEEMKESAAEMGANIFTLPVKNIKIKTVATTSIMTVKAQAILRLYIDNNFYVSTNFFIFSSKHMDSIIFGADILRKYKSIINYKDNKITFHHLNNTVSTNLLNINDMSNAENQISDTRLIGLNNILPKDNDNIEDWQLSDTFIAHPLENNVNVENDFDVLFTNKINEVIQFQKESNSFTDKQCKRLCSIFHNNKQVFQNKIGTIPNYLATFELMDEPVYNHKVYPCPEKLQSKMQDYISELLDKDIIEYANSNFISPLIPIKKPDGSIRGCLDLRTLNTYVKNRRTAPQTMEQILKRFSSKKFFSTFDISSGYQNILVEESLRDYLAFNFNGQTYRYKKLPFGLKTSQAIFVHAMNEIFHTDSSKNIFSYVDDFVICTSTFDEHCKEIDNFLSKAKKYNIPLQLKKSCFLNSSIRFLGQQITPNGCSMLEENIAVIKNFPKPHNVKSLQKFLGLINYYKNYNDNQSKIIMPLTNLLKKNVQWKWGVNEDKCFQEIKDKFLKHTVLSHPNFDEPFYIFADASHHTVAGALSQFVEGHLRPIAFYSRTLNKSELNYSTCEKELLAIVSCLLKWKYILDSTKIVVYTDHQAIKYLRLSHINNSRLLRWILAIQEFDAEFRYVKGEDNKVADILSRLQHNDNKIGSDQDIFTIFQIINTNTELESILKNLTQKQLADERIKQVIRKMQLKDTKIRQLFQYHNNILFRKDKNNKYSIILPESLFIPIIDYFHESYAHIGRFKLAKRITESFYIPNINKVIADRLKSCDICQRTKPVKQAFLVNYKPIVATHKLQTCFIDIFGPLPRGKGRYGAQYGLIIVDTFTKYTKIYTLYKATSDRILKCIINDYIKNVGKPEKIISDNGSQFTSRKFKDTLETLGIKVRNISLFHPQSNPSERYIQNVKQALKIYCNSKHDQWPEIIPYAEQQINVTVNHLPNQIPYELMFEKQLTYEEKQIINFPQQHNNFNINVLNETVRVHVKKETQRRITKFKNKQVKEKEFKIGDKVLIRTHFLSSKVNKIASKLMHIFAGPYTIIDKVGHSAYKIQLNRNKTAIYNTSLMRPYFSRNDT